MKLQGKPQIKPWVAAVAATGLAAALVAAAPVVPATAATASQTPSGTAADWVWTAPVVAPNVPSARDAATLNSWNAANTISTPWRPVGGSSSTMQTSTDLTDLRSPAEHVSPTQDPVTGGPLPSVTNPEYIGQGTAMDAGPGVATGITYADAHVTSFFDEHPVAGKTYSVDLGSAVPASFGLTGQLAVLGANVTTDQLTPTGPHEVSVADPGVTVSANNAGVVSVTGVNPAVDQPGVQRNIDVKVMALSSTGVQLLTWVDFVWAAYPSVTAADVQFQVPAGQSRTVTASDLLKGASVMGPKANALTLGLGKLPANVTTGVDANGQQTLTFSAVDLKPGARASVPFTASASEPAPEKPAVSAPAHALFVVTGTPTAAPVPSPAPAAPPVLTKPPVVSG